MKKKLEIQTILALLCALLIASAWIFIQIENDSLGLWTESSELRFTTGDLLGLGVRSELRCAGALIGHVHKITPEALNDGSSRFTIVAGVGNQFAGWRFKKAAIVKLGVVESALSPSSIHLKLATRDELTANEFAQPRKPNQGPPLLNLEREESDNGISDVTAEYKRIGDRIDKAVSQFTEPQKGHAKSVMGELAEAIPSATASLYQIDATTKSLSDKIDPILTELQSSALKLEMITDGLNTTTGKGGKLNKTLDTMNKDLRDITDATDKTAKNLNLEVSASLHKANSLLDETNATMKVLHEKVEHLGNTFVGRMLIGKETRKTSPTPAKTPRTPAERRRKDAPVSGNGSLVQ